MTINELYGALKDGEQGAEHLLFKKLYEAFFYFAEQRINDRQDAEELVQEVLLVIANKYRDIEIVTSFSAWAYKILDNHLMHYIRKKYSTRKAIDSLRQRSKDSETPNPDLKMKLLDCLKKINRVNARYARILNLRYQGYTTEEIAHTLDTSSSNVLVILSRARSLLKACLKKGDI